MKKQKLLFTFLLILLTLVLTACSGGKGSDRYVLSPEVISTAKDASYAKMKTKFTKKQRVASSGLTELYFDEKTCAIAVKDNTAGDWWYALSPTFVDSAEKTPCVLALDVLYKGQRYYLDSQSDCVAKGTVTSEKTENGIKVTYTFNPTFEDGKTAVYTVPVNYSLVDGSLYVTTDCKGISGEDNPDDAKLINIELLNFFGSSVEAKNSDYILVPDNCGGLIYPAKANGKFENVSLQIYGDTKENNAIFGAYGVKKGDSAFVAVIEKGDAIATVNATVAATGAKYNKVGASFAVTETQQVPKNDEKTYVYVPSLSYEGEISLCYRFLSGNNADYSGMAIVCREQFIRNGMLSSQTVEETGDLPFVVSVIGSAVTKENGKTETLTTFEQLQDMLTLLKGKGFNNIYVKYKGALSGGLDQSGISESTTFLKSLGASGDLKELKEYTSAQKIKLFFDISYLTSPYGSLKNSLLSTGATQRVNVAEEVNMFGVSGKRNIISLPLVEDNVILFHNFLRQNDIKEVSVADSSQLLYSDYASGATREDVKAEIAAENLSLSSSAEVMVSKGNFYTLKNASIISSLPTGTSIPESKAYESVPFIQLILHGTLDYSSEPINYSKDYKKSILKALEYGSIGEFEWIYEDITQTEATDEENQAAEASEEQTINKFSYSGWANEVYAYYMKGNKALSDLRGSRMTEHYKVKNGIYCTEYGDTSIYVNYTNKDYEVQGVTVPANDFMRIN